MPMKIAIEKQFTLLAKFLNQALQIVHSGVRFWGWVLPDAVEVNSCEGTACVSINYSVRINHRHNFEDKLVTEQLCAERRPHQVVDDAFHHKRRACLAWVNARTKNNPFAALHLLKVTSKVRYN